MATVAHAPELHEDRARRLRGPLGVAAAVGSATLALHVRDPHQHGSWGLCPFKALTGWDCPLCGGLRAVNDLGHGRLADAAHSNPLFVASIPVLVGLWALWVRYGWTGERARIPTPSRLLVLAFGALVVAFTVFRNTPWGSAWHAA
jgi:hypothetical protein